MALLEYLDSSNNGLDLARARAFEEAIARCMADNGFEYIPDVPAEMSSDPGQETGNETWYATWGYGISIDVSGAYSGGRDSEEPRDANAEYVASLGDAARRAYFDALEGTLDEGVDPSGREEDLGCYVQASVEIEEADPIPERPALVLQLEETISALVPTRIASDLRVRDAVERQVQCVVSAGGEVYDPLSGESAYEQVDEAFSELTDKGPPEPEALAAFQGWERSIAAAEFRCGLAVAAAAEEVRREVTGEVVGPHIAELRALVEADAR